MIRRSELSDYVYLDDDDWVYSMINFIFMMVIIGDYPYLDDSD